MIQETVGISVVVVFLTVFLTAYIKEKKLQAVGHHHDGGGHRHEGGIQIDVYSYQSRLRPVNAGVKVAFSVISLLLCIILDNPFVSLAILSTMAYLTMIKGGLSFHKYLSVLTIPLTFIILGTFTIAIEISQLPILDYSLSLGFFYINTSSEKLMAMFFMMIKVFAAVSALQMMALTTPSSEIISVMRKAHVPKLIIELMNMIYRFIFILLEVYGKMKNSATSRLGYHDLKTSYKTFGSILGNILVIAMKKATTYYNAMEARCYDGDLVFLEEEKKINPRHLWAAGFFFLGVIGIWLITS